jgi:hypothetical protein
VRDRESSSEARDKDSPDPELIPFSQELGPVPVVEVAELFRGLPN